MSRAPKGRNDRASQLRPFRASTFEIALFLGRCPRLSHYAALRQDTLETPPVVTEQKPDQQTTQINAIFAQARPIVPLDSPRRQIRRGFSSFPDRNESGGSVVRFLARQLPFAEKARPIVATERAGSTNGLDRCWVEVRKAGNDQLRSFCKNAASSRDSRAGEPMNRGGLILSFTHLSNAFGKWKSRSSLST